jgi:hypothetical protein
MSEKIKPGKKYFADQLEGEEVLYVFRRHPIVMRKGLILSLIFPLIGVLPTLFKPELGFSWFFGGMGAGLLGGMIVMFPYWVGWHFSVFITTNQRFIQITQKGFFHRSVADLALNQIQSINYAISGIQETLLGFGTIMMQTYVGDLVLNDIHKPAHVQKKLVSIFREQGIAPSAYPGGNANNEEFEIEEVED